MMKLLLLCLVLFESADGAITNLLIQKDIAREVNPFLSAIAGSGNFLLLKIVGALLCAVILWRIYGNHAKLAKTCTACFVLMYFLIISWNLNLLANGLGWVG